MKRAGIVQDTESTRQGSSRPCRPETPARSEPGSGRCAERQRRRSSSAAARSSCQRRRPACKVATPKLTVTPCRESCGCRATAFAMSRAVSLASRGGLPGRVATNSSPPSRAAWCERPRAPGQSTGGSRESGRSAQSHGSGCAEAFPHVLDNTTPIAASTRSPATCPCRSLKRLKSSTSKTAREKGCSAPRARTRSSRCAKWRRFGSPVSGSVSASRRFASATRSTPRSLSSSSRTYPVSRRQRAQGSVLRRRRNLTGFGGVRPSSCAGGPERCSKSVIPRWSRRTGDP